MSRTIKQLEALILTQLNQAPLNAYCKTIAPYDGELATVDAFKKILGKLPVCYVRIPRVDFVEVTPGVTYDRANRISVLVAARDLRGAEKARSGTNGAYDLVEDVRTLLHLNNLGQSDIAWVEIQRAEEVLTSDAVSVWEITFRVNYID